MSVSSGQRQKTRYRRLDAATLRDTVRPGPYGRLLIFVITIALAALAAEWRVISVLLLASALALALSPEAFQRVRRDRVWPMLLVFAIGLGAIFGERDLPIGPIYLSSSGLAMGAQMMLRALAILLAVHTLTTTLSLSNMAALFERAGLRGLGFALGVAINALPVVQRTFQDVITALRLRGGFRRRRFAAARMVLLTTMVNSVRHAEDIVAAAEARGFSTDRACPVRLFWQSGDFVVLALMLVAAGLIVFI